MTRLKQAFFIRTTLSGALVVLVLIISMFFVNTASFERYYRHNKVSAMVEAYREINEAFTRGEFGTEKFESAFRTICERNNLSILVIDYESRMLISSDSNYDQLNEILLGYVFGGEDSSGEAVIERTGQYEIRNAENSPQHFDYIDMWGVFDNGNLFIIRSPLAGIREDVRISKTFFNYIMISMIFVTVALVVFRHRVAYIKELRAMNDSLISDINKRKEEEMMRSNFLSDVSHELKTPLALIQGYAEGLKEGVTEDPKEREYYCDVIVDEVGRMNGIIKKLMDLSRLERGDKVYHYETFDITELIRNYLNSIQMLCKPKNVTLSYEAQGPLEVYSDEYEVREVLNNYVTNALNYVTEGGRILVRTFPTEEGITTTVFNDGPEIPEENIDRIWDRFYKVDKSRTRTYGGSGIGLSIVRAIMTSMKGRYGVRNCGDGVEFFFTICPEIKEEQNGTT